MLVYSFCLDLFIYQTYDLKTDDEFLYLGFDEVGRYVGAENLILVIESISVLVIIVIMKCWSFKGAVGVKIGS